MIGFSCCLEREKEEDGWGARPSLSRLFTVLINLLNVQGGRGRPKNKFWCFGTEEVHKPTKILNDLAAAASQFFYHRSPPIRIFCVKLRSWRFWRERRLSNFFLDTTPPAEVFSRDNTPRCSRSIRYSELCIPLPQHPSSQSSFVNQRDHCSPFSGQGKDLDDVSCDNMCTVEFVIWNSRQGWRVLLSVISISAISVPPVSWDQGVLL
jgi:hypothetical protein